MADFDLSECAIPTVWCGRGNPPKRRAGDDKYYYKTGDRYECMQKGFGAGMHTERKKNLPENSLQQIKYVGDVYEKKFKGAGSLHFLPSEARCQERQLWRSRGF